MKLTKEVFALLALLVGAAIIAMFVARPKIITDVFQGFSGALSTAISPVTGSASIAPTLRGRFP